MTTERSIVLAAWVAAESAFATDPSADGSGYAAVKLLNPSQLFPSNERSKLETNYATGRGFKTASMPGPDLSKLTLEIPLAGLTAAAGSGAAPAAADYLDLFVSCALGSAASVSGSTISSAASGTLTTGTDTHNMLNLLCVYEAAKYSGLAQWRHCESTSAPYNVHRAWDDTPSSSGISYGNRYWDGTASKLSAADSLSLCVLVDGRVWRLSGGYVAAGFKVSAPPGQIAKLIVPLVFASKTEETSTKTALPAITSGTFDVATPIIGELHELEFNGALYETAGCEIDFGVGATHRMSSTVRNAAAGVFRPLLNPSLTIHPPWALGFETAHAASTLGNVMVRLGAGTLASSRINSWGFYMEAAEVGSVASKDDAGYMRQDIQLACRDGGQLSGSTYHKQFILARA